MRSLLGRISRNLISLIGAGITTASAIGILTLFGMELLGHQGGPYIGILAFCILPGIFVGGLLLIPAGLWWERWRRAKRGIVEGADVPDFPVIDLNKTKVRNGFLIFFFATTFNVMILALAMYKGVEVMDSTEFCGKTCHSVMSPEFTTYQRSPHARVTCVSCHIGPGAGWFVKSKLSGSWQMISVNLNLYPKPIPTPVHSLRPARETCEQCHWPEKFVGDRMKVITHFDEDEANTEKKTVLLVRVGGMQSRASKGIHWHVDPGVHIRYRADEKRQKVTDVELTLPDGTKRLYTAGKSEAGEGWRTMDCVDCHNRPTHIYRVPQNEIDQSIALGHIDRSLPFVRREGLRLVSAEYPSQDVARQKISEGLTAFYRSSYPDVAKEKADKIDAAGKELGEVYCYNVFPQMEIKWGTYPNHLGHQSSPGCFRCHDDEHKSADGHTISQDCNTCHTMLAVDEANPDVLKTLNP